MSAAAPPAPARDTGLPPGVRVGPLGRRLVAYVVDSVVPGVAAALIGAGTQREQTSVALVVLGLLLGLAWTVVFLQQLAVNAASPGMRLMKLQLVGFLDGRPVGWARAVLRWLVFTALGATGIGLLLLVASVLVHLRHQGWHDRAAGGVVIVERPLAPRVRAAARTSTAASRPPAAAMDGSEDRPRSEPDAPADGSRGSGSRSPVSVPAAVAGDPAVGPELAPLAGSAPSPTPGPTGPTAREDRVPAHRTIRDGWFAELDDGRRIEVRGLVLLGRNPQPGEDDTDAELVKLPDESRTVSKTHLALGVDDAGLFVVDRGSTNGSTVTAPGREAVPVDAFRAVSVGEGSVVSIGDHWLRIRRTPG